MPLQEYCLDRRNINSLKQNKIKYVVNDLADYLGLDCEEKDLVRKVLIARGISKWLVARRRFIVLKNELKKEITKTHAEMKLAKEQNKWGRRNFLKGYLKGLLRSYNEIRDICHMPRFVVDEKDRSMLYLVDDKVS